MISVINEIIQWVAIGIVFMASTYNKDQIVHFMDMMDKVNGNIDTLSGMYHELLERFKSIVRGDGK